MHTITARLAAIILALAAMAALPGCNTEQVREQAQEARQLADNAGTLGERITAILDANPPSKIEDSALADIITATITQFNADWVVYFENARAIAGNVRDAARAFVAYIPELQANLIERADNLDALADANKGAVLNTIGLGIEWLAAIFGAGGIAYGVRQTIKAFNTRKDAEIVVRSMEVAKDADPEFRQKLEHGQAGVAAKAAIASRPGAIKLVKNAKG